MDNIEVEFNIEDGFLYEVTKKKVNKKEKLFEIRQSLQMNNGEILRIQNENVILQAKEAQLTSIEE